MSPTNPKAPKKAVHTPTPRSNRRVALMTGVTGCVLVLAGIMIWAGRVPVTNRADAAQSHLTLEEIPFNGVRAYRYLEEVCALGRRPSGSEGMAAQQDLLEKHFMTLGGGPTLSHSSGTSTPRRNDLASASLSPGAEGRSRMTISCYIMWARFPRLI